MCNLSTECGMKDEDFMIDMLNNLNLEYDVPLDSLENHLMMMGAVLTIELM